MKYVMIVFLISSSCSLTRDRRHESLWPDAYENPNISILFLDGGGLEYYDLDIDTCFIYKFISKEHGYTTSIQYFYNDSANTKMIRTYHANGMIFEHADRSVQAHDFLNKTGKGIGTGVMMTFWPNGNMNTFSYGDSIGLPHGSYFDVDYNGVVRSNIIFSHGEKIRGYFYSSNGELDSLVNYIP